MATSTIRLRADQLDKHMAGRGIRSSRELAKLLGLSPSTVARIRAGRMAPGERFIAELLDTFRYLDFADLFEVVPDAAA